MFRELENLDNRWNGYQLYNPTPATGVLYSTSRSPDFISGHLRLRGRDEGRYPYFYLEMIDKVWGPDIESNTIEVCSRYVSDARVRVDLNKLEEVTNVDDGQTLDTIPDNLFSRWRCDPPYNVGTARSMYGTSLPITSRLLTAGARVCKKGALMFLLLGAQNYQWCPVGVKRTGWIAITIVPNNELRTLNVYRKMDASYKQEKLVVNHSVDSH